MMSRPFCRLANDQSAVIRGNWPDNGLLSGLGGYVCLIAPRASGIGGIELGMAGLNCRAERAEGRGALNTGWTGTLSP